MNEYPKIQSVYKRDPARNNKRFILGDYSIPEFAYLAQNKWEFTEKVDGTCIRVIKQPGRPMLFFGKSDESQIPSTLYAALDAEFKPLEEVLIAMFPDGVTLYGEGFGAKIQKGGGNYRPDQGFVLFDIQAKGWWLNRTDVYDVATKLQINNVPVIGVGTLIEMEERVSRGFKSVWGDFQAEGIVARPLVQVMARDHSRIITKLKFKDFN